MSLKNIQTLILPCLDFHYLANPAFGKSRLYPLYLTFLDKTNKETLGYFGQKIRETREKQNLLLRQVAAHIEVDTALMSKAERGERNLNRKQVIKLAQILKASEDELVSLWLCDKVIEVVGQDPLAELGIKTALTKIKH